MAPAGNGCAHAAFRYTALARIRLVAALTTPGLSRSLILPAVCSAMNWLISCLACSAARRKSASRTATAAAALTAAVKPGSRGRPDWTHIAFGARRVRSPAARSLRIAETACRSWAAWTAGAAPSGMARCRAAAICAAVSPRAPSSTRRSAVAMLAGEKTRLPWPGNRP